MRTKFSERFLCSLLFISLTTYSAVAQNVGAQDNVNRVSAGMSVVQTFDKRYEGIKGSPVIFENFLPGIVVIGEETIASVLLNFDAYNNEILYKTCADCVYKIADNTRVKSFTVNDKLLQRKFAVKPIDKKTFEVREVMYEGKFQYYRLHKVVLNKADYQGAYSANQKYDEFVQEQLYFYSPGTQSVPLKLKAKNLKQAFPQKADGIDDFIKQNKIDFKNDQHLIRLFEFIDSN